MDYIIAGLFFLISILGAYVHYLKDRYWEHKIDCSLIAYCLRERSATFNALKAIAITSIPLAMVHTTGWNISLSEVYGLIGVGYGCDSFFNRAS